MRLGDLLRPWNALAASRHQVQIAPDAKAPRNVGLRCAGATGHHVAQTVQHPCPKASRVELCEHLGRHGIPDACAPFRAAAPRRGPRRHRDCASAPTPTRRLPLAIIQLVPGMLPSVRGTAAGLELRMREAKTPSTRRTGVRVPYHGRASEATKEPENIEEFARIGSGYRGGSRASSRRITSVELRRQCIRTIADQRHHRLTQRLEPLHREPPGSRSSSHESR